MELKPERVEIPVLNGTMEPKGLRNNPLRVAALRNSEELCSWLLIYETGSLAARLFFL